jgi:hypothetical protein
VNCFACNATLELGPGQRVGFRDACEQCATDLHVCRNCAHHDPSAYNECRESSAERVSDRERANHCDYFTPGGQEGGGITERRGKAHSQLDALFKKS